jgi:hypothetical protein
MSRRSCLCLLAIAVSVLGRAGGAEPPGVVINYISPARKVYVGSPGIAVLPDGSYLAKHDEFGPKSTENTDAVTQVFRSRDQGRSWQQAATVHGMYWASIFVHGGTAYLLGTSRQHGFVVISRSADGGTTWTIPKDKDSGLLLDADSWTASNRLGRDERWLKGQFRGWLEGNAVVTPEGRIVNILRVDYRLDGEKAAMIEISEDGKKATFDPESGFIDFPGGAKKFTIRYDSVSKMYWTLSNPVLPGHRDPDPGRVRNAVALMRSPDLRRWEIRCIVLYHPDVDKHGFQYLDWLFEGEDIIAVSRTAWGAGADAPPRQHDANYLTLHRFRGFRELNMNDCAPGAGPDGNAWTPRDGPAVE